MIRWLYFSLGDTARSCLKQIKTKQNEKPKNQQIKTTPVLVKPKYLPSLPQSWILLVKNTQIFNSSYFYLSSGEEKGIDLHFLSLDWLRSKVNGRIPKDITKRQPILFVLKLNSHNYLAGGIHKQLKVFFLTCHNCLLKQRLLLLATLLISSYWLFPNLYKQNTPCLGWLVFSILYYKFCFCLSDFLNQSTS